MSDWELQATESTVVERCPPDLEERVRSETNLEEEAYGSCKEDPEAQVERHDLPRGVDGHDLPRGVDDTGSGWGHDLPREASIS